ncbi:glycosyltransferase family 61 protein [Alphaproteobacteria bacterium]|nr:glycosyltransferase family 61 protein [Alphaproteobacteria bacterium]
MNEIKVNLFSDPAEVYQLVRPPQQDEEGLLKKTNPNYLSHLSSFRLPTNYYIENARVLGASNLILNSDDEGCLNNICFNPLVEDKIFDKSETNYIVQDKQIYFQAKSKARIKNAIFLGGHWNYGHWMFNHLARLYYCDSQADNTLYIVGSSTSPRYLEYLYLFGIEQKNIFKIEPGMVLSIDNLTVPQMPWHSLSERTMWWSPGSIKFLRDKLGSENALLGNANINVFLTRKNARWRRVINEDQLFNYASKYDFIRVDPAELSIDQQIDLGKQTKVLITPAGANSNFFINLPKGANVMELGPPLEAMNVGPYFISAAGLSFEQVLGVPKPMEEVVKENHHQHQGSSIDLDYIIDFQSFKERLDAMFE